MRSNLYIEENKQENRQPISECRRNCKSEPKKKQTVEPLYRSKTLAIPKIPILAMAKNPTRILPPNSRPSAAPCH